MSRFRIRSVKLPKSPLDMRPDSEILQERRLFQLKDPFIAVLKGEPQLVDHIDKSPQASVTPTIVKIRDPITNKPLCVLYNPKVPFKGYS